MNGVIIEVHLNISFARECDWIYISDGSEEILMNAGQKQNEKYNQDHHSSTTCQAILV